MTDEELKEFNSAGRMTDLMTANDSVFKTNAKAMQLKTAVLDDILILQTAGANRVSAAGKRSDGTTDSRAARQALDKFLRKFAANAKVIKKAEPDFDNRFVLPEGSLSSQQLLDTAGGFKNDLTAAAAAKFAEFGFTAATAVNIDAKVNAFQAGRGEQTSGKSDGVAATAETKAAIKRLKANRRTLKEVGENILEEHGDAGLIAEWNSACKIAKKKKTDDEDEPPAPPTP